MNIVLRTDSPLAGKVFAEALPYLKVTTISDLSAIPADSTSLVFINILEGDTKDSIEKAINDHKRFVHDLCDGVHCLFAFEPSFEHIKKHIAMSGLNRIIFDMCRYGYAYKKRVRVYSNLKIDSVLCDRLCPGNRHNVISHDPKSWTAQHSNSRLHKRIHLLKLYDERTYLPIKFVQHLFNYISRCHHSEEPQ